MEVISRKLLQKAKGRKRGKYLITLEVTDYDIEMFEDLSQTYAPFEHKAQDYLEKRGKLHLLDFKKPYANWTKKVYYCFWKLWNNYDD